ncbi:MAG: ABC transporter ATP-binding protein [Pollutimonas bauzanensis]|uniref:Cu-processing system ATP-binding protein n=1 Tax=Pollutimonas bauzanensis TaxID=658167 RepID=A0A1M5WEM6_9BURK|nr:ABC transporter ATP-binding protein [Pollutimonas bauzanensis]SHH85941.1 Cu-processing system ATP-binding protein [Pollutimonas bauzanensis]
MTTFHVALSGVTKDYGKQRAVDGIDLNLRPGECVALAGHNGAGKSTLIKLILGLIRPSSGQVLLLGHEASGSAAVRMRNDIGYLPETVALHPSLTGAETLAFYARLKRQPLANNAALLARVGISQAAKRRVGGYSKGMRQRLALAQALLGAPKVLLFDEPTTGLDPASRLLFYEIVRELRNNGSTVLLSTHALAELDGHTDRIVVLKNGSKIADGSMSQLRHVADLPIRIRLRLAAGAWAPGALPDAWRRVDETQFELACSERDKVAAIRGIGAIGLPMDDIEIHTPSLDDMYAHFLRREDV